MKFVSSHKKLTKNFVQEYCAKMRSLICLRIYYSYFRFGWGLGMQLVGKSDLSTGNTTFASYVLKSNDLVRAATIPYPITKAGSS